MFCDLIDVLILHTTFRITYSDTNVHRSNSVQRRQETTVININNNNFILRQIKNQIKCI